MFVKMKPVCDCGYVFEMLHMSCDCADYFGDGSNTIIRSNRFSPSVCPRCGSIIDGIVMKFPVMGEFHYDDSEFSEGQLK